jgi:beta-1,4-mannosyltransferase
LFEQLSEMTKKHVVVLVLGDIGRSPRMQYHSRSLAELKEIDQVSVVGYEGEKPVESLRSNPKVSFRYIKPLELSFLKKISVLKAIFKGLALLFAIFQVLWSLPAYQLIIIQNPPGIPAVIVALLISVFNQSKVMIDWHNLGFSVYEISLGKSHFLVKLSYFLEKTICSLAHYHLCVSKALNAWLKVNFKVNSTVLYDRPGAFVTKYNFSLEDRHNLLLKLQLTEKELFGKMDEEILKKAAIIEETIQSFKLANNNQILPRTTNRIALIISSTSWTADEDFSILLTAMENIETFLQQRRSSSSSLSASSPLYFERIVCVITGKGELKSYYEQLMDTFNQKSHFIKMKTRWLEFTDYPKLLFCSNVGISLHTSTSGLDLPMKVLDLVGSSLPGLAKDFPTISELVQVKKNGFIFQNENDLTALIQQLFFFPVRKGQQKEKKGAKVSERLLEGEEEGEISELEKMRDFCGQLESWEVNWNKVMKPIVLDALE